MKLFRVYCSVGLSCYYDIEADNEDEASDIAEKNTGDYEMNILDCEEITAYDAEELDVK